MTYKEMSEKAASEGRAVTMTPVFVKLEKIGDAILGRFKAWSIVRPASGEGTEYRDYTFDTDNGLVRFHLGAQTDKELDGVMQPGGVYSITYKEDVKLAKGRHTKKYTVLCIEPPIRQPGEENLPF